MTRHTIPSSFTRGAPAPAPVGELVCGLKPPKRPRRTADPLKSASRVVTYRADSGLAQVVNDENARPKVAVNHAAQPESAPIERSTYAELIDAMVEA